MLKAKNLRDQAVEELEAMYSDCQKSLFRLVNEAKQAKKAEKPHLIREKRKDIARLLTVIHQKQSAKQ
ncbi:MAG TPA: 50S ribosomal protein L29 [Parachlamydiaceae bacterium]|nr:50S ribosomal protein L29 [Parachlamydiaceae bacterium]